MLRLQGAQLVEVPAVPYANPNNYVKLSGRLAERLAKEDAERRRLGQSVRQCRQPRRPYRHHRAGDFRRDSRARWTASSAPAARAARSPASAWRSRSAIPTIKIGLADPFGAALYSYYTTGELKAEGSSITEGIGQGRITANLEGAPIDVAYQIPDDEALDHRLRSRREGGPAARRLLRDQCRRRHPSRPRSRARPHDRDDPLRRRRALRVEALQRRLPAQGGSCRRRNGWRSRSTIDPGFV